MPMSLRPGQDSDLAYEIAAYRSLIAGAAGLGLSDAVALLKDNLDQETHTSEELETALRELTGI